ncbi:MAG: Molybdopterin-synthase adenylyltransferase [Ktedonobacterales bacterium]|jgi:adenylyltransferase/sulfurtransferase|nr:MAG: Molybdopterin-synthase adenylyltransferase [Ktedonobacterales bacterium]
MADSRVLPLQTNLHADPHAERSLSASERYARQTLFAGIRRDGQERITRGRVLIVGCGALGTVLANNLARAGVGHLRIADRDYVEGNNLQRQVLFDEEDVRRGMPKAIAAAQTLSRVNSLITVEPLMTDVTADNIEALLDGMDLVLDGTDNFETRYLLNDACLRASVPWIYSGVIAGYGVTMNVLPRDTACLRCVFPERPLPGTTPTCDTAGVLNGIVGAIAGIASTEALKLLVGSDKLARGMTWVDLWENTFERIELPRQEDCPACGRGEYDYLDATIDESGVSLCGRNAVQVRPPRGTVGTLDLDALAERLRAIGEVASNGFLLRLRVDNYDVTLFPDARAIIKGTDDPAVARSVYAKYVGM